MSKQLGLFPSLPRTIETHHLRPPKEMPLHTEQFARHMPGQTALPVDSAQRFTGREIDEFNPAFHAAPNAHVDRHGFIRDNTAIDPKAYKGAFRIRGEVWEGAGMHTVTPDTQIHTLQGAEETSQPSQKPMGMDPTPPRMVRIRGTNVLLDGHHRVADARKNNVPISVQFRDLDEKMMGMPHHEFYGL